jgi:molecular chaperone IbpA
MKMTTANTPSIFRNFEKFGIGFDDMFDNMMKFHDEVAKNIPNYPPYNIKKTDENTYVIEMAVAGFGKSDIEINVAGDTLQIKGNAHQDTDEEDKSVFFHQGLALRPFTRMFNLNDQVEVKNAEMINGVLKIALERIIPESKKPRKVEIK